MERPTMATEKATELRPVDDATTKEPAPASEPSKDEKDDDAKGACCPVEAAGEDVCLCCGLICLNIGFYKRGCLGCRGTAKCCCVECGCCCQPGVPLLCTKTSIGCGPLSIGIANPWNLPACYSICHAACLLEQCAMPLAYDGDIVSTCAVCGILCDPEFQCCPVTFADIAKFRGRETACHVHQDEAATWCCVLCTGGCLGWALSSRY